MPVAPRFILLAPGQWTPICDQRDSRRSLLVCALGGDTILSTTTNTPLAQGPVAACQAGIYLEGGQNGTPTIFRLSETIDSDTVHQEWYAQPVSIVPSLTAVVFSAGAGQTWFVPIGVTQIVDAYIWGGGGSGGLPGAVRGGGGGGGGGFANSGPITVVPGDVWTVDVSAGGGGGLSKLTSPASAIVASANSGAPGLLDAGGTGGAGTIGPQKTNGGNGSAATALGGQGASGGGAGGAFTNGTSAVGQTVGLGGGAPITLGYGMGGFGGSGAFPGNPLNNGGSPGGGGGGDPANSGLLGTGADGMVVIFYSTTPLTPPTTIAIFEAFDMPPPSEDVTTFTARLPQLDTAGKRHLETLRERIRQAEATKAPTPAQEQ